MESYSDCPFVSNLFHITCLQGSSMLEHVSKAIKRSLNAEK